MRKLCLLGIALLALGCHKSQETSEPSLFSVQIIDRNGFSETISSQERLKSISKVDFQKPQPYQKVLRVFSRQGATNSKSMLTTYHNNGHIWQMLEIQDGRAHGLFQEWYSNGKLKIEAHVIEGTPEVTETAQMTWLFDGKNTVWDEQGNVKAEIFYSKGALHSPSKYYHPNGSIEKIIPYEHNHIEGFLKCFDDSGTLIESIPFHEGEKHGCACAYWNPEQIQYLEEYEKGLLLSGKYYTNTGSVLAKVENGRGERALFDRAVLEALLEYRDGVPNGKVSLFSKEGFLISEYHIRNGKKNGVEILYYPRTAQPKLSMEWRDDIIHGIAKSWYPSGVLESQRTLSSNKKHGAYLAWYEEGDLMLAEEYENDILVKGSYFKKGEKIPASRIDNGKGFATLYDSQGIFVKKVPYEKGHPVLDNDN